MAVGLDFEEGLGGQEAVAADLFAADDALEEAGAATGVDLVEGADRGQGVAEQAAIDRHQRGLRARSRNVLKSGECTGSAALPVRPGRHAHACRGGVTRPRQLANMRTASVGMAPIKSVEMDR